MPCHYRSCYQPTPTRRLSVGRPAAGRQSLSLTSLKAPTAVSSGTSWSWHNKTYQERSWIWKDPEIFIVDPGERLHDYLRALYQCFEGEPTLYLIDDCAATKALTKKKDMLSELAFSGRHAGASVWVLTQKFNAVGKDLREQTKWVALFHCKDRDSFEDCLRENDVIPTREERAAVRQLLAETKHAKLVLKTDQPAAYQVLCWA